jgi:hypothetical protein
MKTRVLLMCLAVALLRPFGADAQTDVSYRIRSLGVNFAGILDDYLTDAFLNPARTAQLDGQMIYGTKVPSRRLDTPFLLPPSFFYFGDFLVRENSVFGYGVAPIAATYFRSASGRRAFSLSAEVSVSTEHSFDKDGDIHVFSSGVDIETGERASSNEIHHYLVDLAFAAGSPGTQYGVRLTGSYDQREFSEGSLSDITTLWSGTSEVTSRTRWSVSKQKYERAAFVAEAGLSRREGVVRDLVISGGVNKEQLRKRHDGLDIRDEDADGNGFDPGGRPAENLVDESMVLSDRDYSGADLSARLHLQLGSVRSTHRLWWSRSTGDGEGGLLRGDETLGANEEIQRIVADYAYDGSTNDLIFETTFGGGSRIVDDVLVAVVVYGAYVRRSFEEDGTGAAALELTGNDSPVDTTFTSPYLQHHDNMAERLVLRIPVAMEWEFHRYARLRIGIGFVAVRDDADDSYRRELEGLQSQAVVPYAGGVDDIRDAYIRSSTAVEFNNGLEFNFNDRFVLDLLYSATYSSVVRLADYSYLSARYRW